jgi:hypothetical protein
MAETDLAISWDSGGFKPKGAALLDERLVNDPLHWLRDEPKYQNVLAPFEKGLKHFTEAHKTPDRYRDVVRDMHEALEAIAKTVTERGKDLSGNRELFVSKLDLPKEYKEMLKLYIAYANDYRHAVGKGQQRMNPTLKDVEAFVYMTGLFIRLAIQSCKSEAGKK